MILLLILVFIRYYIDRGRLLFCPCSGCQAASLTELGVGYAWENSPLRLVRHCVTFVRTIFPGVWEVSVMRHGGQASDEIEDDLYQYNII